MKKLKRISWLFVVIMLFTAFFGCFDPKNNTDNQERVTLRLFLNSGHLFDGVEKDSVWKKIEEDLNITIRVEGATHNSDYYTTLNPMLNTGDFPDIIFSVPSNNGTAFHNWSNQSTGILWNLDLLIAQKPGAYPWIEKILNSDQYKNIKYDDAHTLLPYVTSPNGWGIYYRTDWLINVGFVNEDGSAKIPATMDEFEEVLKRFTLNDPDQNGQNDTWGLAPGSGVHNWAPLYHAFGVRPDYDIYNGEVQYMYTTEEFKNFLAWANQMYKNGYIYPQFNTNINNQDRDFFIDGKTGILITNAEQHVTWIMNPLEAKHGKGKVQFGEPPVGTANIGKPGAGGFSDWGGWWGGFSITLACKNPHAAMKLLNYLYSPEGNMLRIYGIEGKHYTLDENGKVIPNLEERAKEPSNRFMESKDQEGNIKPFGKYRLGATFGEFIDWSEFDEKGVIKAKIDPATLDYYYQDLIAEGMAKNKVVASSLKNITAWPYSILLSMNRIEDISSSFANNAILGTKNLTTDWNKMISDCNNAGYANVKRTIKEVAQSLGVI
ncbi:MAG TPA: extracellular solute-binding protein [Clostridia bacterium]